METKAPQRPKIEIKSLADLIFGLALSIGAIALIGNVNSITSPTILQSDIATFAFSFFLLISIWMGYTRIMSVLPFEDFLTLSLNSVLLFTVSMEPFLYFVLVQDSYLPTQVSSQYFALDLGAMNGILGAFSLIVGSESRKLVPPDSTKRFKIEGVRQFVAAALFIISAAPIFWMTGPDNYQWRYYLWIIILVLSLSQRRTMEVTDLIRKRHKKPNDT